MSGFIIMTALSCFDDDHANKVCHVLMYNTIYLHIMFLGNLR